MCYLSAEETKHQKAKVDTGRLRLERREVGSGRAPRVQDEGGKFILGTDIRAFLEVHTLTFPINSVRYYF